MVTEAISFRNIHQLKEILKSCVLCPRRCGKNRVAGETGFCGMTADVMMNRALSHHGEEPPIAGTRGAGTLFMSSCNLRCVYCQNYQISHTASGERMGVERLSEIMLTLQKNGCHNIEPVTPTPQIPQIMEAVLIARRKGLRIPLVYNCGGYENPDVLKLLDGMVDIYLPDFKYGDDYIARAFSGVSDYSHYAIQSIQEMVWQVGDFLAEDNGISKQGIIIRHLILPGFIANSFEVLELIKKHLSIYVPLSIMSQYTPMPSMKNHPLLGRRITGEEYERVVNYALDMGFETIFTQDVDDRALTPDFEQKEPFDW